MVIQNRTFAHDPSMRHRTVETTLTVRGPDGQPLRDTPVVVEQSRHEFLFGCIGFDLVGLANGEDASTATASLAEQWLELFNAATLPFYWGDFEPVPGRPDTAQAAGRRALVRRPGRRRQGPPAGLAHGDGAVAARPGAGAGPRGAARPHPARGDRLPRRRRHLGRRQRGRDHAGLREGGQRDHPAVPRARAHRAGPAGLRRGPRRQSRRHAAAQRLRPVERLRVPARGLPRGRRPHRRPGPADPHAPGLLGRGAHARGGRPVRALRDPDPPDREHPAVGRAHAARDRGPQRPRGRRSGRRRRTARRGRPTRSSATTARCCRTPPSRR